MEMVIMFVAGLITGFLLGLATTVTIMAGLL